MPRYVLLYHACPPHYQRPSHWDFMLESGEKLRTWALPELPAGWQTARARTAADYSHCPPIAAETSVAAQQLGEHRREFLEFEGPLTGNRGSVIRVAAGTYIRERETPDTWQVTLSGDLAGRITLRQESQDSAQWTLSCA